MRLFHLAMCCHSCSDGTQGLALSCLRRHITPTGFALVGFGTGRGYEVETFDGSSDMSGVLVVACGGCRREIGWRWTIPPGCHGSLQRQAGGAVRSSTASKEALTVCISE